VSEIWGDVDCHRAISSADKVVLLGVAVQESRHRVRPGQYGKPRRHPFHAMGKLGREVTGIHREPQHRLHPALSVELGPGSRADRLVRLR
jgi:hypothetical protein